jgi:hypothetical protein
MKHKNIFDVLVVYSDGIAKSATNRLYKGTTPFPARSSKSNYNNAYAYFLESCASFGLKAAFTTSGDVIGTGMCKSFWTFENDNWQRVKEECFSTQIFDKFSPINKTKKIAKKILFSSKKIRPFNNAKLSALFFDKHKTYKELNKFSIPTVSISGQTLTDIKRAVNKLRKLVSSQSQPKDFGKTIILKDRYGAGGNNIYKIDDDFVNRILKVVNKKKRVTFVLQPFVIFDRGYSYKNYTAATDIRLIYQNGKIIQTYVRMAKPEDFRCNEHQGGSLIYTKITDIPKKVISYSEKIAKKICQDTSLFALDFIVSNRGNVYLLEGNIGPGLDWNLKLKRNEIRAKYLIDQIVEEISNRVVPIADIKEYPVKPALPIVANIV